MLTICAPDNPCSISTTFGQERNMPIWVACVARAHVDRGRGAVIVEKDRDVEALRTSSFALATQPGRNPSIGHGCAPHQFAASSCLRIPRIRA
jgi:hypothetical protein